MARPQGEETGCRLGRLSEFQSAIAYLLMAVVLVVGVGYQVMIGRVFTKSGDLPIGSGLGNAFLTVELVAAVVGAVRGIKTLRAE